VQQVSTKKYNVLMVPPLRMIVTLVTLDATKMTLDKHYVLVASLVDIRTFSVKSSVSIAAQDVRLKVVATSRVNALLV
jgi:hypothetical protein